MWVINVFVGVVILSTIAAWLIYGIWRLQHPGQKW
jgi:hypothetical protein